MNDPKFTPTWMNVSQAARGWGVSVRQARRIIRAEEKRIGRRMSHRGRIRTVDFLAIPRGDVAAAPMIPEVAILWAKLDALEEQQGRILRALAAMKKTS